MSRIELGQAYVTDEKYLPKVGYLFDRGEALLNAAKAIKGLKALDDDALEHLYSEAKAERRERNKSAVIEPGMRAFSVTFAGTQNAEVIDAMRTIALGVSIKKPDVSIEHMHVSEDGRIEVTYIEDGQEVIVTYSIDE